MFETNVDCIVNGAPHSHEAKMFADFFREYDTSEDSFFLRTFITYNLFQKTEKLQEDTSFSLDTFKKYLEDSIVLAKTIAEDMNIYKEKLDNSNLQTTIKKFDESTQEHYGNLFKEFSDVHYYDKPADLLESRLIRNDISIDNIEDKIALDGGCGGGRYTLALKKMGFKKVYGVDLSQVNIDTAIERRDKKHIKDVEYKQANVHNLPFVDNYFDFVFSNGVLHHTNSIEKGLSEIYRTLKPGGKCWLFLIEKPGGIHWDIVELLRIVMEPVPQEYARNLLRLLGVPETYRLYYILDHILVPINTRSSIEDLEKLIKKTGFKNLKRLERGIDFDRIEKINKIKQQKDDKDLIWKYGVGENRYIFEK